jgi:hypothetical protein
LNLIEGFETTSNNPNRTSWNQETLATKAQRHEGFFLSVFVPWWHKKNTTKSTKFTTKKSYVF